MAQHIHTRCIRPPRQEQEIHVFTNLLNEHVQSDSSSLLSASSSPKKQRERLEGYDYQAPLTARSLRPNSKWLIVRRKLHRIRYMGFNNMQKEDRLPNIYLTLQMTRELKRAKEEIINVDKEEDFRVIKKFVLATDKGTWRTFHISHVKPDDALFYDRLGEEPLVIQNLLYYFSDRDVPHGTVFWNFLNEVMHVLNLKRKRSVLIQRLRRLALILALIFYSCIGLMFLLMVISVITSATKMNDPEVEWMNQNIGDYSTNTVSLR